MKTHVTMRIDKTRKQGLITQFDHPGLIRPVLQYLFPGTHRNNVLTEHGYGIGSDAVLIHGNDVLAQVNDIGVFSRHRERCDQCDRDKRPCDETHLNFQAIHENLLWTIPHRYYLVTVQLYRSVSVTPCHGFDSWFSQTARLITNN